MPNFVLDCSVTISWFIADETNSSNMSILEKIATAGAIVPSVWPLEVGNVLLNAKRNKHISIEQMRRAIYSLNELPIIIDNLTAKYAWQETIELAEAHNLSLYDASYLELALRFNLPLVTLDKQLIRAAEQKKIIILN